jgi:hypothetical protein
VREVELELSPGCRGSSRSPRPAHYIESEVEDGSTALDGIPPSTFTLKLRRNFSRAWVWVRLGAYDALDDPGPTEQSHPGYSLLDAAVGARFGSRLELSLLGRTLLD